MNKNTKYLVLLMTITVFALGAMSACSTSSESASGFTPASAANDGDVAVQQRLAEIQARGTLEAIEAQRQITQDVIYAQHTSTVQAQNWQATQIAATATQQAHNYLQQTQSVQNTQRASTQQAQNAQSTATAQAAYLQATATVQAASQQATNTAQVQGTQSALSVKQTQTAMDFQSTADANAIAAAKKVQDAEVERVELALKRERMMNEVAAAAPYLVGMIGFIIFSVLLYRWGTNEADRRKVFTDKEGVPQGVVDVSSQGVNFTRTDRMPSPTYQRDQRGNVTYPQAADPALQGQVTMLALMAEIARGQLKPRDALNEIQAILQGLPQLPGGSYNQLPQGQVIDIQVVDVSNQTAEDWMTDVQDDFVNGSVL